MGKPCLTPDHQNTTHGVRAADPLAPGRIFDGSAVRTGDELNAAVTLEALSRGWAPTLGECWHDSPEDLQHAARAVSGWLDDETAFDAFAHAAGHALAWLGEHAVPVGHVIVSDDGIDVVPDAELSGWGE